MIIPYKYGDIRDTLLAITEELPGYIISWAISDKGSTAAVLIEEKPFAEIGEGVKIERHAQKLEV